MSDEKTVQVCRNFSRGSCVRSSCNFVHNENPHCDCDTICRAFGTSSGCQRGECRFLHNVNPNAPHCGGGAGQATQTSFLARGQKRSAALDPMEMFNAAVLAQQQQALQGQEYLANLARALRLTPDVEPSRQRQRVEPSFPAFGLLPQTDEKPFELCRAFSKGNCNRQPCRFVHNVNENAAQGATICYDYSAQKCTRTNCKYVHNDNKDAVIRNSRPTGATSPSSLPSLPAMPPMSLLPALMPSLMNPVPPLPSLPTLPSLTMPLPTPRGEREGRDTGSVELCRDFTRGNCARNPCRYVHNVNENATGDLVKCADFKSGKCTRARCRFLHDQNEMQAA